MNIKWYGCETVKSKKKKRRKRKKKVGKEWIGSERAVIARLNSPFGMGIEINFFLVIVNREWAKRLAGPDQKYILLNSNEAGEGFG
jgi:hypothetical protein